MTKILERKAPKGLFPYKGFPLDEVLDENSSTLFDEVLPYLDWVERCLLAVISRETTGEGVLVAPFPLPWLTRIISRLTERVTPYEESTIRRRLQHLVDLGLIVLYRTLNLPLYGSGPNAYRIKTDTDIAYDLLEADLNTFDLALTDSRIDQLQRNKRQYQKGYIYILKTHSYYKIGKTKQHSTRISRLQAASPFEIITVGQYYVSDHTGTESELHALFAPKRVRSEWFELDDSELQLAIDYLAEREISQ